jgi:phosphoribosylformimino-5-aminoimidazole carboxamide ribotide isomerase
VIAIPAVDLREGACVQLVGGSYADERVRLRDPVAVAQRWTGLGFQYLHVVDLDAATGVGDNASAIASILDDTEAEVRVGGGVRSHERVDELLAAGARHVIVGTRAVEDVEWLEDLATAFPASVIVAADVRERTVTTHGWNRSTGVKIFDFLADVAQFPIAGVLVTAVHREGRMAGPDLTLMRDLVTVADVPIIASGGIATYDDLRALEYHGVSAAVIGMALYTGALDPRTVAQEFAE